MDVSFTFTHKTALLCHNGDLADPTNPVAKAMAPYTSKRSKDKTDEDYQAIERLEFAGSLYFDEVAGPYIPGENIQRCLVSGAAMMSQSFGTALKRALFVDTDVNPIGYKGPRTVDELWALDHFRLRKTIRVGRARVVRVRPIFRQWTIQAHGVLDTSVLDFDKLCDIADNAGSYIGLGDWRPRFGRFEAKVERA